MLRKSGWFITMLVFGVNAWIAMPLSKPCFIGGVLCRTIINGLCYLSTFVFAANSVGLTLYSLQLALFPGGFSSENSAPGPPIEEKKGDTRVD